MQCVHTWVRQQDSLRLQVTDTLCVPQATQPMFMQF